MNVVVDAVLPGLLLVGFVVSFVMFIVSLYATFVCKHSDIDESDIRLYDEGDSE